MSYTWDSPDRPDWPRIGPVGWVLIVLRAMLILGLLGSGLIVSALVRIAERLVHATRRPWTAPITRVVLRCVLRVTGLRLRVQGQPMTKPGAVVANHVSWLDILALHASQTVVFVAKSEVSGWPGIGFLARFVGTVFIARDPRAARAQRDQLANAIEGGARLMLFPEGTSTDGMRVLHFKSTIFEMMFMPQLGRDTYVQPVSVIYDPPDERGDPRLYAWWGDMALGPHLLMVLSLARQGGVTVVFHDPLEVCRFDDRKALARAAEEAVRTGLPETRRARG